MGQVARSGARLDLVRITQVVATMVTWLVTLVVAAALWSCSNDVERPGTPAVGLETADLVATGDEADGVSFTCTTSLTEHRDPCLEGACCGFEQQRARLADGGDALCAESAQCGYGTLEEEGAERATGAVCACSFCGQFRVSCLTDYESGSVECTCTEL
jgi:hypothetical protein